MTESQSAPPSRWSRQVIGPFTLRHLVVLAVVLVAAAAGLALLTTPISSPDSIAESPGSGFYQTGERTTGLALGQLAPELEGVVEGEVQPLTDLDGNVVSLEALRGSPVWLSFFATWCPPCQEETPVLRDAYAEYHDDGLEMIAVSVQESTPVDVAEYADNVLARLHHRLRRHGRGLRHLSGLRATDPRLHRRRRRHRPPALRAGRSRGRRGDNRAPARAVCLTASHAHRER